MKVTIYELLGMIKDGKTPKNIKYDDIIWKYDGYYYNTKNNMILEEYCNLTTSLNDEVEIIEEKPTLNDIREKYGLPRIKDNKIPEKFRINYEIDEESTINMQEATILECDLAYKINEIIDYLEEIDEQRDDFK